MQFSESPLFFEQLKTGNVAAYDYLMHTYYKRLCVYALSLTKDEQEAEDIVQNVIVRLWEKRKKISVSTSLSSYLHRSVYNEFIAYYRKSAKVTHLEKKHMDAIDTLVEDDATDMHALMLIVEKEIAQLPAKCKEVFLLNKKDGLTHREISEYLDISIKTIEGHMARAFAILNKKLGDKIKPILFMLFNRKANKKIIKY